MNFIRSEFDKNAEFLTKKMFENPKWAIEQLKIFKDYADKYFICAERLLTTNLIKLSDRGIN